MQTEEWAEHQDGFDVDEQVCANWYDWLIIRNLTDNHFNTGGAQIMDSKSIYQQMVEIGVPIGHHESDLHVPVTQKTQAIINDYEFKSNVQRFLGNDGHAWFDIPFAYDPFWERLSS